MAAAVPAIIPAGPVDAWTTPPPATGPHLQVPWTHQAGHSRPAPPPGDGTHGPVGALARVGAPVASAIGVPASGRAGAHRLIETGAPTPGAAGRSPAAPSAAAPSAAAVPAASSPVPPSATASPAAPSPAAPGPWLGQADAPTSLILSVSVGSAAQRSVTLRCDPPGGTHPKAARACADLTRSHGEFTVQSQGGNPRACFMIYSPVTVNAQGQWHGEQVQFNARFPNTCVMRGQTGAIFDF